MGRNRLYIYDLNGTVTDTDRLRKEGWRDLSSRLKFQFTDKHYQKISDLEPKEGLERILKWSVQRISEAEKHQLIADLKKRYLSDLEQLGPEDIQPGFKTFNRMIRQHGARTAAVSTNRHAVRIVDRLDLVMELDAIADARMTEASDVLAGIIGAVLDKTGITADEACFISPSDVGIRKARELGLDAILFTNNGRDRGKLTVWEQAAETFVSGEQVHQQQ